MGLYKGPSLFLSRPRATSVLYSGGINATTSPRPYACANHGRHMPETPPRGTSSLTCPGCGHQRCGEQFQVRDTHGSADFCKGFYCCRCDGYDGCDVCELWGAVCTCPPHPFILKLRAAARAEAAAAREALEAHMAEVDAMPEGPEKEAAKAALAEEGARVAGLEAKADEVA